MHDKMIRAIKLYLKTGQPRVSYIMKQFGISQKKFDGIVTAIFYQWRDEARIIQSEVTGKQETYYPNEDDIPHQTPMNYNQFIEYVTKANKMLRK